MITVVVPTLGRPSLLRLLDALAAAPDPVDEILLVDDRRDRSSTLVEVPGSIKEIVRVVPGRGRGPAAARNAGWRAAASPWIVFLDDDVEPSAAWVRDLRADLSAVASDVVAVQGRIEVPLPADRRPTDWERVTAGLVTARWITADMAVRRAALAAVGGFDERFPRAFREDADLAARLRRAGGRLTRGRRVCVHPVRQESPWVSLRTQAGNADDALLRRLYGRRWRQMLDIPPGRRHRHAMVTTAGLVAVGASLFRRGVPGVRALGVAGAAIWVAGTAEFAARRIAPGPRTPREVALMLGTSVLIPLLAVAHWLRGWWRWRGAR